MAADGWIKDYRKEVESAIWLMPPLYHRVWQWLKYAVNHDEANIPMKDGSTFKVLPGQRLTSYRNIAKVIGWYEGRKWNEPNPKTVSGIIAWLQKNSMITIDHGKGNREYTLITLVNWDLYQSENDKGNAKVTVRKHLVDINKNDIRMNKNIYSPVFEEFWAVYLRKDEKAAAYKNWNTRLKEKVNPDDLIQAAKNYAAECQKEHKEAKFIKQAKTFLGSSRPYEDYLTKEPEQQKQYDENGICWNSR